MYYFICLAIEYVDSKIVGEVNFGVHSAYNDFDRHRNKIKDDLKSDLQKRNPGSRIEITLLDPRPTIAEHYTKEPKKFRFC